MTFDAGFPEHVLYERLDSHIGLVMLNRPEKRNAISPDIASMLGDMVRAAVPLHASAARATDLSGLPATFIHIGAIDLFLEESLDYARRLTRASVAVELHVWPGAFHAFGAYDAHVSREARRVARTAIKRALHGDDK